jgi:hypothetical protein
MLAAGMHQPDQNPPQNLFQGQQYPNKAIDYQSGVNS